MVPVEEQGASSSTASNGRHSVCHSSTSAATISAASESRVRLSRSRASRAAERSTAVTRAPASGKLRGLAAGRRAQIGDAETADVAEQARRQRGGGVLHPPGAFGKAGQQRDRAMRQRAHRAGRQHAAVHVLGPAGGVVLDGEVERRLVAVGGGDRARGVARRRF